MRETSIASFIETNSITRDTFERMAANCFWPGGTGLTVKSAHWLTGLNNNIGILSSSQNSLFLDDTVGVCACARACVRVRVCGHTTSPHCRAKPADSCEMRMWAVLCVKPAADAADAKWSRVSNNPDTKRPQAVTSGGRPYGDYKNEGSSLGGFFRKRGMLLEAGAELGLRMRPVYWHLLYCAE